MCIYIYVYVYVDICTYGVYMRKGGHGVVQPGKEGNRASAFADLQAKGFNTSRDLGFRV